MYDVQAGLRDCAATKEVHNRGAAEKLRLQIHFPLIHLVAHLVSIYLYRRPNYFT